MTFHILLAIDILASAVFFRFAKDLLSTLLFFLIFGDFVLALSIH